MFSRSLVCRSLVGRQRRRLASTLDWHSGPAGNFQVTVQPDDYSMIIWPRSAGAVSVEDHDRLHTDPHRTFVCTSMMNPDKLSELLGSELAVAPAMAPGHARIHRTIDGLRMPFMVPNRPPANLAGVVILGLSPESVAKLHAQELHHPTTGRLVRRNVELPKVIVGDAILTGVVTMIDDDVDTWYRDPSLPEIDAHRDKKDPGWPAGFAAR